MLPSVQNVLLAICALLVCASGKTTTTQVSGRSITGTTSTPKPASLLIAKLLNSTQSGRFLLNPSGTTGHSDSDRPTDQEPLFSELELERLCPPGNTEILKSIPKETMNCLTGGLDFWYQRCRCHYVKWIPCPPCPEEPQPIVFATSNNVASGSGQPNPTLPHFVLGAPQANSTYIYQIPLGEIDKNGTVADFATANKFAVYNSAGGIVNLYFYQTGQQQIVNPGVEGENSHNSTTSANHTSTTTTTRKPFSFGRSG